MVTGNSGKPHAISVLVAGLCVARPVSRLSKWSPAFPSASRYVLADLTLGGWDLCLRLLVAKETPVVSPGVS
jgi:hypothetical protein